MILVQPGQWQQFASLWGAAGSKRRGERGFTPGPMRPSVHDGSAHLSRQRGARVGISACGGEAAQAFADFLRDRFAELQMPWRPESTPAPDTAHRRLPGATCRHSVPAENISSVCSAWPKLRDASMNAQRRLQRLWSDALREAAAAFAARLAAPQPPAAPSAEALRALYDSWIDCAEEAYARMAHGEAFCSALADVRQREQPMAPGAAGEHRAPGEAARSADAQ